MPRLRAELWVRAYLRRCDVGNVYAAVSRRGDPGAGAIFIECLHRDGADLWGPRTRVDGARGFERLLGPVHPSKVAERLANEAAFDGDLWVVTVEDRDGRAFLLDDERV
ncbi:DUF1491 family protein [Acuticoccus sp.]|uniref:DUF1491 family protein n=1 Tax=Acuticoccus sp. TaxID=1904378 RepID=UPI003B52E286